MAMAGAGEHDLPFLEGLNGCSPARTRAVARIVEVASEMLSRGGEVHYIGADGRMDDIRGLLRLTGQALRMVEWPMQPLCSIGRWGTGVLTEGGALDDSLMEGMGVMALPEGLWQHFVGEGAYPPRLLILDGVPTWSAGASIALEGIRAFARRWGISLAILP